MFRTLFLVSSLTLAATPALAHTGGAAATGLLAGLLHPLSGLDHLLALLAAGLLAARLGGQARWRLPLAVLAALAAGALFSRTGFVLPGLEPGLIASLLVLGGVLAAGKGPALPGAIALVAGFALLHGHAHGLEQPGAADGVAYALGFLTTAALLQAGAIGLAGLLSRLGASVQRGALRLAGAGIAAGGLVLATL